MSKASPGREAMDKTNGKVQQGTLKLLRVHIYALDVARHRAKGFNICLAWFGPMLEQEMFMRNLL